MMDHERVRTGIVDLLKGEPIGLSVTDISRRMGLNRNSTAKYLDVLQVSGRVEMRPVGKAKLYYPSYSVPINAMLNFSSDLIMVLDRSGTVIDANRNLLTLLGTRREMAVGMDMVASPLPLFEGMELRTVLRRVIKGTDHLFEVYLDRAGSSVHLRGRMLPTSLSDGSKGVTVILEDVTERKRSELRLKESESRYRTLFDNSLDALLIVDGDRIIDVNTATLAFYGLGSKDEIIGRRPWDFSPKKQPDGTVSADMIRWGMEEVLKGKDFQFEWVQLKKGAGQIFTLMTVRPILLHGKVMVHASMRDISQMRSSEDRVRVFEERLRMATSSMHSSFIGLLDNELFIKDIWTSEGLRRRMRISLTGRPIAKLEGLFSGDDRELAVTDLNKVISTGEGVRFEVRVMMDDGPCWYEVRAELVREPATGEANLVVFGSDISEQRRLRESLETTVHRTRVLDETLRDIIWMADQEMNFIFLSSSVERVLGFAPEELVGEGLEKVLTPGSYGRLRAMVSSLLGGSKGQRKDHKAPSLLELESVRKDGQKVWTELSISVHREVGSSSLNIIGATRDISRRKSAERDLYRLSRAFQFSNEAMIITDERSRILDLNAAAIRVLGASDRGELLGTVGLSLLAPSDLGRATEAMETAEPTPDEGLIYTIMDKAGSVRQVEVFSSPIPGEDGSTEGFIILIRPPPVSRTVSSPI